MAESQNPADLSDFVPANKLPEIYPLVFKSQYGVEWLIRHREENGYAPAFVRYGRQWLCNTKELARILSQSSRKGA